MTFKIFGMTRSFVTRAAALALVCASVVHADNEDPPAQPNAADWKAVEFAVLEHKGTKPGHVQAKIFVLRSFEKTGAPVESLVFAQRQKGYEGTGMVCEHAKPYKGALRCKIKGKKYYEEFTVGPMDSNFCADLIGKKKTNDFYEAVEPKLCEEGSWEQCICYEIDHCDVSTGECKNDMQNAPGIFEALGPPDNGSGTGGGNFP